MITEKQKQTLVAIITLLYQNELYEFLHEIHNKLDKLGYEVLEKENGGTEIVKKEQKQKSNNFKKYTDGDLLKIRKMYKNYGLFEIADQIKNKIEENGKMVIDRKDGESFVVNT